MITKQIAGLLYSFSYQLQDNERNVWDVVGVLPYSEIQLSRYDADFGKAYGRIGFDKIGSTYKILAREMDLTKPIEGVGVPLIELAKIAFPHYEWTFFNNQAASSSLGVRTRFSFLNNMFYCSDEMPNHVPNQLSLFNWLYTHHFNLDFPEGTTTNLI